MRLAILLRLAATLHRTRKAEEGPPVSLAVGDREVRLAFPAGWLAARPLSQADMDAFARALKQAGYALRLA